MMKTIKFTTYWRAEDADTVIGLLDDLRDAIWAAYGLEIAEMYKAIAEEQASRLQGVDDGCDDEAEF